MLKNVIKELSADKMKVLLSELGQTAVSAVHAQSLCVSELQIRSDLLRSQVYVNLIDDEKVVLLSEVG
jgi:hypothetical protein